MTRGISIMQQSKDLESVRNYNKRLCEKYPFLLPYAGRKHEEGGPLCDTDYDYEFTELDSMPAGWRKAFGIRLCDELKSELVSAGLLESYRIAEIKEKWGELRWYDNGSTSRGQEIIDHYTRLSRQTCILCGKKAKWITQGWIAPYCDECIVLLDGDTSLAKGIGDEDE